MDTLEGFGWRVSWSAVAAHESRSSGVASCMGFMEGFVWQDGWSAGAAREPRSSGMASMGGVAGAAFEVGSSEVASAFGPT